MLNTGGSGSLSAIKPRLLLPRADDHAPPTVSRPLSAAAAGDAVPAGARRHVKKEKEKRNSAHYAGQARRHDNRLLQQRSNENGACTAAATDSHAEGKIFLLVRSLDFSD